jgi:hypothetical protein
MGTETLASTLEEMRRRHRELTEKAAKGQLSEEEYREYQHLPRRIRAAEEDKKVEGAQESTEGADGEPARYLGEVEEPKPGK